MGPIDIEDLNLESTFKKIERIAILLEEINEIAADLKENEEIELSFKIELI